MNIYAFDPNTLKAPLTFIYNGGNKRWSEEVHFVESRDSENKLIIVNAADAGADLGAGVSADAVKKIPFVRIDAVYAAHNAIGLGPWFKFNRIPGFYSEGTGIVPQKK